MKKEEQNARFRDHYIAIGIRISYFRKLRGLSQEQLAERAGISPGFLSQVEAPGMAVGISLSTLFLIAEALEIPPYKLLQFDDCPASNRAGRPMGRPVFYICPLRTLRLAINCLAVRGVRPGLRISPHGRFPPVRAPFFHSVEAKSIRLNQDFASGKTLVRRGAAGRFHARGRCGHPVTGSGWQ